MRKVRAELLCFVTAPMLFGIRRARLRHGGWGGRFRTSRVRSILSARGRSRRGSNQAGETTTSVYLRFSRRRMTVLAEYWARRRQFRSAACLRLNTFPHRVHGSSFSAMRKEKSLSARRRLALCALRQGFGPMWWHSGRLEETGKCSPTGSAYFLLP